MLRPQGTHHRNRYEAAIAELCSSYSLGFNDIPWLCEAQLSVVESLLSFQHNSKDAMRFARAVVIFQYIIQYMMYIPYISTIFSLFLCLFVGYCFHFHIWPFRSGKVPGECVAWAKVRSCVAWITSNLPFEVVCFQVILPRWQCRDSNLVLRIISVAVITLFLRHGWRHSCEGSIP